MSSPRIDVDLSKIRRNTRTIVGRLGPRGTDVTAVTKAVCGHPDIAQAMLDGGAVGLADARLSNIETLRNAGMTCPITLIRTPMLSQIEQVVQLCDTSYNTQIAVILALAGAAIRLGTVHDVILMVEMGDQRDGILPENVAGIAQQIMKIPGVALKGIGANFACLSGVAPTAFKMAAFCALSQEIEKTCGRCHRTVSGGNSANLPWALGQRSTGCVNDLRLGEAILLGVEPVSGNQIGGMHTDAFTLVAEVIETNATPTQRQIAPIDPSLERLRIVPVSGVCTRLILAVGQQDTDISGLSMPSGTKLIGATSDHLVLETSQPMLTLGSEVRFQMNYPALMQAMAAPDMDVNVLRDQPPAQQHRTETRPDHLMLV